MEEHDILGNIKEELKGYKRRLRHFAGEPDNVTDGAKFVAGKVKNEAMGCLAVLGALLIVALMFGCFAVSFFFAQNYMPPFSDINGVTVILQTFTYLGFRTIPIMAMLFATILFFDTRSKRKERELQLLNSEEAAPPKRGSTAYHAACKSFLVIVFGTHGILGTFYWLNRYDDAPTETKYLSVASVFNGHMQSDIVHYATLHLGIDGSTEYTVKVTDYNHNKAYFNKIHAGDRVKVRVATGRFGVKYVVGDSILGMWRPGAEPAMRRLGAVKDTVRIIADTLDVRDPVAGTIERQLAMGCHATIDGEPAETLYDEKALSSALQAAAKAGSTVELHRPMGDGKVEVWAIRGKQEWTKPSYDEPTLSDITYALKRGKATLLIGGNEAQPDPRAINAALDKHRPVCLRFATSTGARTRYRFMPLD